MNTVVPYIIIILKSLDALPPVTAREVKFETRQKESNASQHTYYTYTHTHIPPWEDQCEWHRMTRMTGPDCVVMCILINTHTHTHTLGRINASGIEWLG